MNHSSQPPSVVAHLGARRFLSSALALALAWPALGQSNLFITEIMYHPVELPTFDTNGVPQLDLSDDVHEFVELHNAGSGEASLDGWRLTGGITYEFPAGQRVPAGGFIVVAKDPARLVAISQYGLATNQVFGPYAGQLANGGDTVRLRNALDEVEDSVSYSSSFPWALGADALGAEDEWTGLYSSDFQYRGRSLERVSYTHPANDPANWLASPLATGPTPGRANSIQLPEPLPIVVAFSVVQVNNSSTVIRSNQPVRLDVTFSALTPLANVSVEYFVDDINATNETRSTLALIPVGAPGEARFTVNLPGKPDRSIVRYRLRADRGSGVEVVLPRPDDPLAWHAYFVSPQRTSANPIYECFISTASLNTLATNISQSPRRVTTPDPPGWPRASWNATETAIVVISNEVVDVQMRHHGSRYRRDPSRQSYKWLFPRYHRFAGRENIFITDKGEEHRAGHGIFAAAGLPTARVRYVDLYLNSNPLLVRLEQEEMDDTLAARWAAEQAAVFPGTPREAVGEFYKSQGVIPGEVGEGPYGIGNCQLLDPRPPYWTELNRYEWTYSLQMHAWKGHRALQDLLQGLWDARGDTPLAPNPNLPALRDFLAAHFDVEATLTYIALRNWNAPFDNATHNHFLWRRANGRWAMLPWDFDQEFINSSQSIYWDEQTDPQPDPLRGPQWVKDSFLKAFREEFKQKLLVLNNTLLNPTNLSALGFTAINGFASVRLTNVNQQLGLGPFHRPLQPVNLAPANNAGILPPAALVASGYAHSATNPPAHASTTWLIRRASGTYGAPVVRVASPTNLTTLPIPFEQLAFGERYFWKCYYTDTNGHPSLDSAETSFVFGGVTTPGAVGLSEILADNRGVARNGATSPDFIELRNLTDAPQDLSQMSLSDNPERPGKFLFPAGTTIGPHGFLVVWCDDATNDPGLHTGFGLDNDGQTVALFNVTTNGYQLADVVTFGLTVADKSISRDEGASGWALAEPTPNATNILTALGPADLLKINEWMATSTTGPDWFELYNPGDWPVELSGRYLTDSPLSLTNTRIPALSFMAARGFRQFIADQNPSQNARHVNFKLSAAGDTILLAGTNRVVIDAVSFGPQTTDVSAGRLRDGSTNLVFFRGSASPDAPNYLPLTTVVISEVLTHSLLPLEDAIELQNLGPAPADLSGWWLSDSVDELRKFRIPTNTVLSPGGFAVFYESQFGNTNSPTAFALNGARGDEVFLSAADTDGQLTGYRVGVHFGAADANVSLGRVPTTAGVDIWAQTARTLGATNSGPLVGPAVISEIQYHPPDLPGDNDQYEFIELANLNASPVDLFDPVNPSQVWRLRDAVDYAFPPYVSLTPGERVLVVPFDPMTNAVALSNFLAVYDLPPGLRLFGPYRGALDNAGESVELVKPGAPVTVPGPDFGYVPTILVDRVRYSDNAPWPTGADGTGASLQRLRFADYGNEPTNWFASGVTPGSANVSNLPPAVTLTTPSDGTVVSYRDAVTISAEASDSDGYVRQVEFFADDVKIAQAAGPSFTVRWSNAPVGRHTLVAVAADDRLGFTASTPVVLTVFNALPAVALVSPADGSAFVLPTNILLQAVADDADGMVTKVEFLADGVRLGEAATPPYSYVWTNARSGVRLLTARATDNLGARAVSAAVTVTNSRPSYVAYQVPAGVVGSQDYGGGLGMDFDVVSPVVVMRLGAFDSGADGINSSSTLTAQLYRRSGNSGTVIATLTFSATDPGTLIEGSRFKMLASPVLLSPGSYTMVGYGHNANNRNGNIGTGNAKVWTTDDGGGLIAFVGSSRYGGSPGVFPPTPDGGPADRYAAGTFEYVPAPTRPLIFAQPTDQAVRLGQSASFSVTALGQDPLSFQWLFNDLLMAGRTNSILQITNVQPTDQGSYRVVVSNALGSVVSAPANLEVLFEPVITQPPLSQAVVPGATLTLSVSVTNNATLPVGYRWRRNNANFPGNTSLLYQRTAFLTITNAQPPLTNYAVVVTNAARPAGFISATATLTFLTDADGDGLPDVWESQFGFNPGSPDDARGDPDGDTLSNWEEYLAGTDPTNALSYLKIDRLRIGTVTLLEFLAISNRTYTIEYGDALDAQSWQTLVSLPARATNRLELVPDFPVSTNRFYRLVTPALDY